MRSLPLLRRSPIFGGMSSLSVFPPLAVGFFFDQPGHLPLILQARQHNALQEVARGAPSVVFPRSVRELQLLLRQPPACKAFRNIGQAHTSKKSAALFQKYGPLQESGMTTLDACTTFLCKSPPILSYRFPTSCHLDSLKRMLSFMIHHAI